MVGVLITINEADH